MENDRLKELVERLQKEKNDISSSLRIEENGRQDGIRDAYEMDYQTFCDIASIANTKDDKMEKVKVLRNTLRSKRLAAKRFSIDIQRTKQGNGFEGTYTISISEYPEYDLLERLPDDNQKAYLWGWYGGCLEVIKQVKRSLPEHFYIPL